jgi:hypothetical protein
MIDILKIVGQIREQLRGKGSLNETSLESLAEEYASAYRSVLERLDLCDSFLNNGYRSEALHLAKIEPEILDFCQMANFEERKDWDTFCLNRSFSVARTPNEDSLVNLNRAYSEDEEIKDLLTQYRELSLSDESVYKKITVLRNIFKIDSNNVAIMRNIKEFESYRLKDLEKEAEQASEQKAWASLIKLKNEILQETWINPPPDVIVNKIKKMSVKAQEYFDNKQFNELAEKVKVAYQQLNYNKVENAMIEFEYMRESLNHSLDNPISKQLNQVRNWIANEKVAEKKSIIVDQHKKSLRELIKNKNDYIWDKSLIQDSDNIIEKITKLTGLPLESSLQMEVDNFKNFIDKEIFWKKMKTLLWVVGPVIIVLAAIMIPVFIVKR